MVPAFGLFYALLRSHGLTLLNLVKYAAPIALVVCFAFLTTVQPSARSPSIFDPLHFLNAYPDAAWPNVIVIAMMLAAAVALRAMASRPQRLIIETLIVLALASVVPGLLLRMPSGSAYYFINVGVWIAIVFAAGAVLSPQLAALDRPVRITAGAALIAILALLSQPLLRNSGSALVALMGRLEPQDQQPAQSLPAPAATEPWVKLFDPHDPTRARIADRVRRSIGGQMKDALVQAGLPGSRDQAVFVPPGNTSFWNLHLCTAQPFFVPATVSAPMVNGLQPHGECPIPPDSWFGYGSYSETSRSKSLSDAELCEKVLRLGFARVAIIEAPQQLRTLNCK